MSTQQQIGVILQDLVKAEGDLQALIQQASTDSSLSPTHINGLVGMQDTLKCYQEHLVALESGELTNADLVEIISAFTTRLRTMTKR
jgi:hypothetical protein